MLSFVDHLCLCAVALMLSIPLWWSGEHVLLLMRARPDLAAGAGQAFALVSLFGGLAVVTVQQLRDEGRPGC